MEILLLMHDSIIFLPYTNMFRRKADDTHQIIFNCLNFQDKITTGSSSIIEDLAVNDSDRNFETEEIEVRKILELDSPVVQISLSPAGADLETKLVVSTENRTIICDSVAQTFVEIGNQSR